MACRQFMLDESPTYAGTAGAVSELCDEVEGPPCASEMVFSGTFLRVAMVTDMVGRGVCGWVRVVERSLEGVMVFRALESFTSLRYV